ncbi:hypothetical protein GQ44DRAFT_702429 [Phaeosphaeriaceae sp. PMI808]|nr:hypothetical protein GQ44DRAFT_702429 [Phaeosphaeriaceae sp. PMI808]
MLSAEMLDSGHHAEMWSIFALGSCQVNSSRLSQEHHDAASPRLLYNTARSLIPNELGKYQLGHVKACLNLALFNLQGLFYNAAWTLVGAASRMLSTIDNSTHDSTGRFRHVVASCCLLDNFLCLLLNRRPYLDTFDLQRAGKIEEDGLEEWQPWDGELATATAHQSRLPTLALSSFNNLSEIVDILLTTVRQPSTSPPTYNTITRLKDWKSSLSPKFDYIQADCVLIPLTPPAVLLQLTHFATALALSPSHARLQKFLELMEACQERLQSSKLPPVLICLLESVRRSSKILPLDQAMQGRINTMITDFNTAHRDLFSESIQAEVNDSTNHNTRNTFTHSGPAQVPLQPLPSRFSVSTSTRHHQSPNPSSLLEDLLPDMNPGQKGHVPPNFSPSAVDTNFTSPTNDMYDPSVSGELDSFFDELASLHGAKKLQNQSQFMENLGFAPEISMADLLATQSGQYMPLDPTNFGTEIEGEPLQFPLSDYYDAG